ncbi:MAG: RNA methyltransferase [Betaproteobacteria bacterium]|nr:RNA methyltransferase [Betaproteobacteria bacterium]
MNDIAPLSRIRVVLAQPSHPGNIGAAARAMKTMGLDRLYLVRPLRFPDPQARAMSANALDVLERAVICATLDEALAGTAIQIAFSARTRELSHPALDARAAAAEAIDCAAAQEAALVFGSEDAGLANEEVLRCNRLAHIPADPSCSSLNLAAAVQVAAYEIRLAALARRAPGAHCAAVPELARHEDVENFYVHLEQSLIASGFLNPRYPRRLMERLRRLFSRTQLEKDEVSILRGMLSRWDSRRRPDGDNS